ncbi:enoyl-CoA hydratase [Actinokineospora guangxiensis]|uniref:Enoyl-CoA hydratase n=1 Tax=Actinokineospora guangxiensis TaxID=1490288 RepID=A0ABW0EH42_9PSEU
MSVTLDRRGGVAVITIDAPERRNALTLELSAALADAVDGCADDPEVGAIVVTGAPPAFCAGADLTVLGESREEGLKRIYAGFLAVARSPLPTIAAVNGAAVGAGLNLALAADVRVAGPKARFDARFLQLGIHPGGGMTWMLQRLVGTQAATAMTLFRHIPDADEAVRIGLAHTAADDPVDAAVTLAKAAAEGPRGLVLSIKATMRATAAMASHDDAIAAELEAQVKSMDTPAFAELLAAMKARITKRG